MNEVGKMEKGPQRLTAFWIFFAFVVWIFAFRGFLFLRFDLTSDALSYYDQTRFFIENLRHGIYPLWDPFWYYGAPNDFFLRRIGAFNPLYLTILVLKSIGIPYALSYIWFLALYYWSAMIAFYLLAMRIYQDRFLAFAGYLLLLFSALGTRLFDSYMMLVTVPLIWFFYFLLSFSQTFRKHFFLGMILSFMVLLGTYIPLYFLVTLVFFILVFFLVYFNQVPKVLTGYAKFLKENKILTLFSLTALVLSCLPIISFFHETAHGHVVLPIRHGDAFWDNALTVPHQTLDWGAVEDLIYSGYFSNLKLFKLAVVYVPFFAIIIFALGLIATINRRAIFMFLLGVTLFCCIVPHGLPFYDFLYKHIFVLKYFRNLHFFIWFFLIPLFVLLCLEHWNMFASLITANARRQWLLLIFVVSVHLIALLFVWHRNDPLSSTYIMITLSLIFWSLMVLRVMRPNPLGFALLTLTVILQPLEVYHYLSLKAVFSNGYYFYDFPLTSFQIRDVLLPKYLPASKETLYYASRDYYFIHQNTTDKALAEYLQYKLVLVDRLMPVDRGTAAAVLEHNFLTNDNSAVVFNDSVKSIKLNGNDPDPPTKARRLDDRSAGFKLLSFNANHLRIALDIPYEKFLIYNDSYDPYWRVTVNHRQALLYEVNGAFKGTWVPAGKNVIEFAYGRWWQYAMNILLSLFAFVLLAGTIRYACLSSAKTES